MQAFSESIKKKREPNPVSTRNLIRTIKENQNKEKEIWKMTEKKETKVEAKAWKVAVLRKIDKCLENQNYEQKKQAAYQKKLGIDTENIELKKEKSKRSYRHSGI